MSIKHDFDFLYGIDEYLEAGIDRHTIYLIYIECIEDRHTIKEIVEYYKEHNEVSTMIPNQL